MKTHSHESHESNSPFKVVCKHGNMRVYFNRSTQIRSQREAQHVLKAAEILQAAVTQQKSISFPLTEKIKYNQKKKGEKKRSIRRKSDSTAQPNRATRLPRESSDWLSGKKWIPQTKDTHVRGCWEMHTYMHIKIYAHSHTHTAFEPANLDSDITHSRCTDAQPPMLKVFS